MRFGAVVLLTMSIVGLVAALFTPAPTPSNPRYGTFGVTGLDGSASRGCASACVR
jgi:hypothetical protein